MAEPDGTNLHPDERTVIDAAADLLETIVKWLRQEAHALLKEKIVLPLQRLGLTLASGIAAATLLTLGLAYISVGSLILLAEWLTWPGALFLIGGMLVLGSAVFAYFKSRMMQK